MNEYLLLKFLHLIAFVYWLGGDLGTFIASRQVVNPALSPQSRHVALKIMLACDMGPKLAMPLILPLGLHLAFLSGTLPLTATQLSLAWAVSIYWFCVVMILYLNEGKPFTNRLSQLDLYFRIGLAGGLLVWGSLQLIDGAAASWAVYKLMIFAAMVACGIAVRIVLKPFGPAFTTMMAQGASRETDKAIARGIARCRPWVWGIWVGLFMNAALGIHLLG